MRSRVLLALASVSVIALAAWFSAAEPKPADLKVWEKLDDGIYRTKDDRWIGFSCRACRRTAPTSRRRALR